jgi:4-methylaminobutanoate oxidase (formaldehyde-forming)
VTSGGFGYTVRQSIAYSYLPVEHATIGTEAAVDVFGEWVTGRVAADQLHDPAGHNIRA